MFTVLIYKWTNTAHKRNPYNYWTMAVQRNFMDSIAKTLNVNTSEDWLKVTASKVRELGGTGLILKYGTLPKGIPCYMSDLDDIALAAIYPAYKKMCRDLIMNIATDLKITKLEDVVTISAGYQYIVNVLLTFQLHQASKSLASSSIRWVSFKTYVFFSNF